MIAMLMSKVWRKAQVEGQVMRIIVIPDTQVKSGVAYYYELGYRTIHETHNEIYERVMQAGDNIVCIRKLGLLDVVAIEEFA